MKNNVIRVTALTILAAYGLAAHAQHTSVKASKTLVSVSPSVSRSLSGSFTMMQAVPAKALLINDVSSRTTAVGEHVTARLTNTVQLRNGTVLSRGTRLLGTVNSVTAASKGVNGTVTFTFDQAQLRDGSILPVKAMIVDVADAYQPDYSESDYLDASSPLPVYATVLRIPADKGLLGVESSLSKPDSGKVVCNGMNLYLAEGAQLKLALLAAPAKTR
jgi:hypothetical protein